MPTTFSDVLLIGGRPNQWVKYVNNDANAAHVYVSTAVSTFASTTTGSGVYTFTNPVPGIYTSYTIDGSLSSTQPAVGDARWAATGITSHVIPLTNGDDAALHSGSFLSIGPYSASAIATSLFGTSLSVVEGKIWATQPSGGDDTAGLLTNLTDLPSGYELNLWPGTYSVLGSGTEALLLGTTNKSFYLRGAGAGETWIKPAAGFPGARDIIRIAPTTGTREWAIEGIRIGGGASALGRHALHLDLSDAGNAASIFFMLIERLLIDPTATGTSIYIHSTATNPTGGLFYSWIKKCSLESILGQYIGDTVTIEDVTAIGANTSIDVSQISGAGGLRIVHNTLVGTKGCVILRSGVSPLVEDNTMEQIANSTEANGAMVDVTGDIASVSHPQILDNQIQVNAGITGVTAMVNLGTTTKPVVDGGRMSVRGAGKHVVVGAGTSNAYIGPAVQFLTDDVVGAIALTDSGTLTQMAPTMTPTGVLTLGGKITGLTLASSQAPGQLFMQGAGQAQIVGGTGGLAIDNNANSATNLGITDAGAITTRGGSTLDDAAGNMAPGGRITLAHDLRRSRQMPTETVLVSGVDATAGEIISVTLSAARVVGAPTNPAIGQNLTFSLTQGGVGAFAVTWNAVFKKTWSDTGNATGKISAISFFYDGTNWIQTGAQSPYV